MTSRACGFPWTSFCAFDLGCEKGRCTHGVEALCRYRKNETDTFGSPKCNPPDSPSIPASTQVQTSLESGNTDSTIESCSGSPPSMSSISCSSSSSSSPLSEDLDPPSSITSPAITQPENAVPYITYSTSSPSASAAAVVTLNAMTVGGIIGITIGGTALGMAIVVCCFYSWRHRRIIFKDRRKSLATQTIKSEYAPTITPYHWPPVSDPNAGLGQSKPVPEMMSFANTLPESVAEVETASEQEVDLGREVLVHQVDDTDVVYILYRSVTPSYVTRTTVQHRHYDALDYCWGSANWSGAKANEHAR